MKYCIGCVYLDLMPGYQGEGGGSWTGPGCIYDPKLMCAKGHWDLTIANQDTGGPTHILDIETEMRRAETCKDYKERHIQ